MSDPSTTYYPCANYDECNSELERKDASLNPDPENIGWILNCEADNTRNPNSDPDKPWILVIWRNPNQSPPTGGGGYGSSGPSYTTGGYSYGTTDDTTDYGTSSGPSYTTGGYSYGTTDDTTDYGTTDDTTDYDNEQ